MLHSSKLRGKERQGRYVLARGDSRSGGAASSCDCSCYWSISPTPRLPSQSQGKERLSIVLLRPPLLLATATHLC